MIIKHFSDFAISVSSQGFTSNKMENWLHMLGFVCLFSLTYYAKSSSFSLFIFCFPPHQIQRPVPPSSPSLSGAPLPVESSTLAGTCLPQVFFTCWQIDLYLFERFDVIISVHPTAYHPWYTRDHIKYCHICI